jgi:TRAP-type C4-dicarboxylate transport system permease small subunit
MFNFLAIILVVLIIYSFADSRNRVYGCIVTSFFSSLLSFFLALQLLTGTIKEVTYEISEVNTSTANLSVYSYVTKTVTYQHPPLAWFFVIVAVVMGILTFLYVIEVVSERMEKEVEL